MTSGALASGPVEAAPRASRAPRWVASPRVLIIAVAALELTNVPVSGYGNGGHPNFFWPTVSTLGGIWLIWRRQRFTWAILIAATAVVLIFYALSLAGVIHTGLPGWWISSTGAADIAALAILLSPPVRAWVIPKNGFGQNST